ncbi:MAG: lysophospholipid acyltransferase family protein [Gammaproteobacteria bacterium]|nr:lysophospholipid acyltransferase family protein [Gammaproteobacteria bacterium]
MDTGLLLLICLALGLGYAVHRLGRLGLAANEVEWGVGWLNRLDGLNRLFCRHYHRLPAVELQIPEGGPAILVSNHISGLDPLLMAASSRRPLRFLIAREQYERFGLRWLFRSVGCIPVDRQRSPEKAMRAAFKMLRQGEVVALFPHGKIHLDSDPPRRLKAGAARLAMHTGAPLVPMRISGIRRQGHVISPVLLRAEARIAAFPVIRPAGREPEELLEAIRDLIEPGNARSGSSADGI